MSGSGNELEVEAVVPAVCNIAIRYDNVSTCMAVHPKFIC